MTTVSDVQCQVQWRRQNFARGGTGARTAQRFMMIKSHRGEIQHKLLTKRVYICKFDAARAPMPNSDPTYEL
jgi:hypothetical protein